MAANEPPTSVTPTAAPAAQPDAGHPAADAKPNAAVPQPGPAASEETTEVPTKADAAAEKAKKALDHLKNLGALADTKELVSDLVSPDHQTRKMARYFVFSVAGILGVLVASGIYIEKNRRETKIPNALTDTGEQGKNLGEFIKKQSDEAKRKYSMQSLGTFTIQLKAPLIDGQPAKRPQGVMDLAEVDIVVQCDDKDTCDFIEDRMTAVRNELTDVFTAMNRDDLLSREGKRRLKTRILTKLNLWLPKGKIEDLFFNKLIVS